MLCKSKDGKSRRTLLKLDPRMNLPQGRRRGPLRLPLELCHGKGTVACWKHESRRGYPTGVCSVEGCCGSQTWRADQGRVLRVSCGKCEDGTE